MSTADLRTLLGIDLPIVQAPMAGGFTTAELVAAVSDAGALGSVGAAYLTPPAIHALVAEIRARTERPFAVNLFAGGIEARAADPAPMLALLGLTTIGSAFVPTIVNGAISLVPRVYPARSERANSNSSGEQQS